MAVRPAEDGEHRVADELLAGPAEGLDRLDHRHERLVDLAADVFRIVLGNQPHVIDEVGEERGDDASVARLDIRGSGSRTANLGTTTSPSCEPHWSQNLAPRRVAAPHVPQRTSDLLPNLPERLAPSQNSIPD